MLKGRVNITEISNRNMVKKQQKKKSKRRKKEKTKANIRLVRQAE